MYHLKLCGYEGLRHLTEVNVSQASAAEGNVILDRAKLSGIGAKVTEISAKERVKV